MAHELTQALQRLRLSDDTADCTFQNLQPGDLFRRLCYQLEATLPRAAEGEQVFSEYGSSGWPLEAYATRGFARKYVSKKFEDRCSAVFSFLQALDRAYVFDAANAEIVDMGAGPGSGAVAAAKFLSMKRVVPGNITLMDPVEAWGDAVEALGNIGIRATFDQVEDLEAMVHAMALRQSHGKLKIVVLSHVLKDFGGDGAAVSAWWDSLAEALHGQRALVLLVERGPCANLVPKALPGGCRSHVFPEPAGTCNTNYGAAVFLPRGSCEMRASVPEADQQPRPAPTARPSGRPRCPDCGSPMALKVNRRGYNPGSTFYGCVGYPNCKGTRPA